MAIKRREGVPRPAVNEAVNEKLQFRPVGDVFFGRHKTPFCVWDIELGDITQTYLGDNVVDVKDFQSVPQWNRFFTGREIVIARWNKRTDLECSYDDINETQNIEGNEIIFNTAAKSTTIYITDEKLWKDEWAFSLFSLPADTGAVLYIPESIFKKKTENNDFWYIEITLTEVNDRLNFLNDERRKHYIHYGAPNEDYIVPEIVDGKIANKSVVVPQVHSFQIDFFGLDALSGVSFYDESDDDNLIVGDEPLDLITSNLYRNQTLQQEMVYVVDSGIVYQGQWAGWQERTRNLYDLQVRPQYEGVLTFNRFVDGSGTSTFRDKWRILTKIGWVKSFTSTSAVDVLDNPIRVVDTPNSPFRQNSTFTNTETDSYLFDTVGTAGGNPANEVYAWINQFGNQDSSIYLSTTTDLPSVPNDPTLTNTFQKFGTFIFKKAAVSTLRTSEPLYKNIEFNFNFSFNTYNIRKVVDKATFSDFLAYNSAANYDTAVLPIEITENVPIDLSTLPIIGKFLFGIPLGFRVQISTTSTGYFDRKYNFLMPKTLFLLLSEGVYGEGDNRVALEAFKEQEANQLVSAQNLSWGIRQTMRYIKHITGDFAPITEKRPLTFFTLTTLGLCNARLRFFDKDDKEIWTSFIRQQSQHTNSLIDWQTIIRLKT